jgi:ribonuclease HI
MKCHHFRSLYDIVADGHRLRLRHSTITANRYQLRSSCTDSTYSEDRQERESIADPRDIDKWVLQFDGGSRGNPGLGGSGAVLLALNASSGILTEVWNCYNFLGEKKITNNVAEYSGLLYGVKGIMKLNIQSVEIQGDSQLVIRQLQGQYQVRSDALKPLFKRAMTLLKKIRWKTFKYIPRELNARADYLSNQAMDSKKSKTTLLHAGLIQYNQTIGEPQSASPIAQVEAAQSDSSVSPTASSDAATDKSLQQQLHHHLELIQQLQTQSERHSDMLSESSIMMTSLDSRVTTLQQSLTAKVKKPRKSKSAN